MRRLSLATTLVGLALLGCSSGGGRTIMTDQSDGGTDGTSTDSTRGTSAADPRACTSPLAADAGVTSLDDLPLEALCMNATPGVQRWDDQCQGSIVIAKGHNGDCASYWLFDPTTKQLQATADGCVGGPRCTGSVPGFVFRSSCFDGNLHSPGTELCAANHADGSADPGDGSSADAPLDAGASPLSI